MSSNFGFRLQGGYTIPQVDWILSSEWIRYTGNGDFFKTAPFYDPLSTPPDLTDILMMPWASQGSGPLFELNETDGNKKIYLNLYDFLLEKKILVAKHYSVLLGAGCRLSHLNQYQKVSYKGVGTGGFAIHENYAFKNLFSGAGMVIKSNLEYLLFHGFGLDANVAFSLLAGKFGLKLVHTVEFPTGFAQPFSEFQLTHENSLKSSIDLAGGVFWRQEFMNGKWGLKVFGNYRFSYWPSQTKLQDILPVDYGRATLRYGEGDVSFLGWEFGANLIF